MARVAVKESVRFMTDCFRAVGVNAEPARQQVEMLILADMMGHPSHGLNRLENYLKDVTTGLCCPNNTPKIIKQGATIALVDAMNTFGSTSSRFAMNVAIELAKNTGIGWVPVRGANHNGMEGIWAQQAADLGYIGIALSNSAALLAPTRSKKAALGTNPLAIVAPGSDGEMLFVDISTTAVSFGKIEIQVRKGEPIPPGWAQGPDGKETLDANLALKTSTLMPLGGGEMNSGYKGYGLAGVVELFTSIASGSSYGLNVRQWPRWDTGQTMNLGQCFMAINPTCFMEGFGDRLTECIRYWRNLEPTDPCLPVLAPGDLERRNCQEAQRTGTVSYVKQQIESSAALAERLKVKPMDVQKNCC